jgi:multiple sugar transport system permease protein
MRATDRVAAPLPRFKAGRWPARLALSLPRVVPRYAVLAVVVGLYLFPFAVVLTTSLKPPEEIFSLPPSLGADRWTLANYQEALSAMPFGRYLFNTALIAGLSVGGELLVAPLVAYSLAKIRWRHRDVLFVLILATMMLPPQVTMIPVYILWARMGLTGSYIPLIVPHFFGLAFFIFMLRQFFRGIPDDLLDAARVEGASELRVYWHIVLPLAKPALVTVAIFTFVWSWTDFLLPLIYIDDPEQYTLSIGLYSFFSEHGVEWGALMAASVLMSLPLILVFLVGQRQFLRGISLTGIK